MKRFLAVVLACVMLTSVFVMAACQDNNTNKKLGTPQNVAVDKNGKVTWSAVDNATSYVITLNGQRQSTKITTTSYQLSTRNKDVEITVIAVADGYEESDASTAVTFKADKTPTIDVGKVIVSAPSEVREGGTVKINAYVENSDKGVTFRVEEGSEYVTIDEIGNVTAKSDIDGDKTVKIRITSVEDPSVSVLKVMNVLSKSDLTEDMLQRFKGTDKIGFEGFLTINFYTYGQPRRQKGTTTLPLHAALDGNRWYAEYENDSVGMAGKLYYSKYTDPEDNKEYAYQETLNLLNQAEQTPLTDKTGARTTWEDSGLYNNLSDLTLDDFVFDEDLWRWKYVGADAYTRTMRIVSSCDPYNFASVETDDFKLTFSLVLDEGEIVGLYIKGGDDHTVSSSYIAVQEIFVAVNTDESTVNVPLLETFKHEDYHDLLQTAIDNMRQLKAYTLDFSHQYQMSGSTTVTANGYYEIINETDCFFRDYVPTVDDEGNIVRNMDETDVYGFRRITNNFYNSYNNRADSIYDIDPDKFDQMGTTKTLRAQRAYNGSFDNAKPSFAFAAELFGEPKAMDENDASAGNVYYIDADMCYAASTMYLGIGNDVALYGMFASTGVFGNIDPTHVVVKTVNGKPYITAAEFYYYLGSVAGLVTITYDNFVDSGSEITAETTVPEAQKARIDGIATRQLPSSWDQLNVVIKKKNPATLKEEDAPQRLSDYFNGKAAGLATLIPFFGSEEALGDTFGFAVDSTARRGDLGYLTNCVYLYYDVPLDSNYTIDSSVARAKALLTKQGFKVNDYGEFVNDEGTLVISVTDESLDLIIYVWYVADGSAKIKEKPAEGTTTETGGATAA